jgi:ribonuclease HII
MVKSTMAQDIKEARFAQMSRFEQGLYEQGYKIIAGVDEAGRGPLAGPVVAAAAILPNKVSFPGLDDSKKLSPAKREKIFRLLIEAKTPFGIGIGTVAEIDELNILRATKLAMMRSIQQLPIQPDFVLLDALTLPDLIVPQKGIIHGDALSVSIAAASVIAKVTRDRILVDLDQKYPGYGFAKHKGYPTKEHIQALIKLGPSPVHRRTFRPVSEAQLLLFESGEVR